MIAYKEDGSDGGRRHLPHSVQARASQLVSQKNYTLHPSEMLTLDTQK